MVFSSLKNRSELFNFFNISFGDFLVLTDTDHDINDNAEINVFVENGEVKLESFTSFIKKNKK